MRKRQGPCKNHPEMLTGLPDHAVDLELIDLLSVDHLPDTLLPLRAVARDVRRSYALRLAYWRFKGIRRDRLAGAAAALLVGAGITGIAWVGSTAREAQELPPAPATEAKLRVLHDSSLLQQLGICAAELRAQGDMKGQRIMTGELRPDMPLSDEYYAAADRLAAAPVGLDNCRPPVIAEPTAFIPLDYGSRWTIAPNDVVEFEADRACETLKELHRLAENNQAGTSQRVHYVEAVTQQLSQATTGAWCPAS